MPLREIRSILPFSIDTCLCDLSKVGLDEREPPMQFLSVILQPTPNT